jgi:hypothetical protein
MLLGFQLITLASRRLFTCGYRNERLATLEEVCFGAAHALLGLNAALSYIKEFSTKADSRSPLATALASAQLMRSQNLRFVLELAVWCFSKVSLKRRSRDDSLQGSSFILRPAR